MPKTIIQKPCPDSPPTVVRQSLLPYLNDHFNEQQQHAGSRQTTGFQRT